MWKQPLFLFLPPPPNLAFLSPSSPFPKGYSHQGRRRRRRRKGNEREALGLILPILPSFSLSPLYLVEHVLPKIPVVPLDSFCPVLCFRTKGFFKKKKSTTEDLTKWRKSGGSHKLFLRSGRKINTPFITPDGAAGFHLGK